MIKSIRLAQVIRVVGYILEVPDSNLRWDTG
jgi:hypothetical protein